MAGGWLFERHSAQLPYSGSVRCSTVRQNPLWLPLTFLTFLKAARGLDRLVCFESDCFSSASMSAAQCQVRGRVFPRRARRHQSANRRSIAADGTILLENLPRNRQYLLTFLRLVLWAAESGRRGAPLTATFSMSLQHLLLPWRHHIILDGPHHPADRLVSGRCPRR